ncbi:MAG: hypothetical protein ABIF71_06205 [Planctomycetota bacterium]
MRRSGVALIMVVMTLFALLLIGVPFMVSMLGFSRSGDQSRLVTMGQAASSGAVEWALDGLAAAATVTGGGAVTDYGAAGTGAILDPVFLPGAFKDKETLMVGAAVTDLSGRIDVNSLTRTLAANLLPPTDHIQALYKLLLYPLRPVGAEDWETGTKAPRAAYRPFRTVAELRGIANILDIDSQPVDTGFLSRDIYLGIRDLLTVDHEMLRSGGFANLTALTSARFANPTALTEGATQNNKYIYVVWSPYINAGTLIRIADRDPAANGAHEYNLCTAVRSLPALRERNQMELTLFFDPLQSYSADTTLVTVPERLPVNINTASRRTLVALTANLTGVVKGTMVTVDQAAAERFADDVIAVRTAPPTPFSADRFMEYNIATVIDDTASPDLTLAAAQAYLIRLNAFQPCHPDLIGSTTGFCFTSAGRYRVTGLASVMNRQADIPVAQTATAVVADLYPGARNTPVTLAADSQATLLPGALAGGAGSRTGPNPVQARDYGTLPRADFGTRDGIEDFEKTDNVGRYSAVGAAPLETAWNPGYGERTSFLAHFDRGLKATVLDGDTGYDAMAPANGYFHMGDQAAITGTGGVFDPGNGVANYARNMLTAEGVRFRANTGTAADNDYLEYELQRTASGMSAADDIHSKLQRETGIRAYPTPMIDPDNYFDMHVYEGFSFDFWLKTDGKWGDAPLRKYYVMDMSRGDAESSVAMSENLISCYYDATEDDTTTAGLDGDIVVRVKDTAIMESGQGLWVEYRQKAAFIPGLWYQVKVMVKGGAQGNWDDNSTAYGIQVFIDGKPCWRIDPDASAPVCRGRMRPGATLMATISAADSSISVDDASDLPPSGVVQINRERIEYTKSPPNSLTVIKRGARGSTADGHATGEQVVLFGYTCNITDFPLMTGGANLVDNLALPLAVTQPIPDPIPPDYRDMPHVKVSASDTVPAPDGMVDFRVSEEGTSITLPAGNSFAGFPSTGFAEISWINPTGPAYGPTAIFYYSSCSGNQLSGIVWTWVETNVQSTSSMAFPPQTTDMFDVVICSISFHVTGYNTYPDANIIDGGRGYVQVEDEWLEYGRDDTTNTTGKAMVGVEAYFFGDGLQRKAMNSIGASHTTAPDVIPVFRVDSVCPLLSNEPGCPKDQVTIVAVDITEADLRKKDKSIEAKVQMTIKRSGTSSYKVTYTTGPNPGDTEDHYPTTNWIAFNAPVTRQYNDGDPSIRLVKFPSGEMPAILTNRLTIGNSRSHTDPLAAEIDEFRINRATYFATHVWDIDADADDASDDNPPAAYKPPHTITCATINASDTVDTNNKKYIEIVRRRNGNSAVASDEMPPTGFIMIKDEIFLYEFVKFMDVLEDPYWLPKRGSWPARYKLCLIGRAQLGTMARTIERYDPAQVLEGVPVTTIATGYARDANDSYIYVYTNKGFPPTGFLRIDNEIIGYTYKGTTTTLPITDFFAMESNAAGDGYFRGRFGSTAAAHGEGAAVTLFAARYPDWSPVQLDASNNVVNRWNSDRGAFYRCIFRRENTSFGLPDDGDILTLPDNEDLTLSAGVLAADGSLLPLPLKIRLRILAAAGPAPDWAATPPAPPRDHPTADIQEFLVLPGQGGVDGSGILNNIPLDLRERKGPRFELRVFADYLTGAWDPAADAVIFDPDFDPAAAGNFDWKWGPLVNAFAVTIKGRNNIYEVDRE